LYLVLKFRHIYKRMTCHYLKTNLPHRRVQNEHMDEFWKVFWKKFSASAKLCWWNCNEIRKKFADGKNRQKKSDNSTLYTTVVSRVWPVSIVNSLHFAYKVSQQVRFGSTVIFLRNFKPIIVVSEESMRLFDGTFQAVTIRIG